jgi:hypothetical protein
MIGVNFAAGQDDFSVTFPSQALNDRDAHRNSVGGFARYWIRPRETSVTASYTHSKNDAGGSNFDYSGNAVSGQLESRIYGPLWGQINYSYDWRNYNGFVSGFIAAPGREDQESSTLGVRLAYILAEHWIIDVYYNRSEQKADQTEFQSKRIRTGFGLTYRF